MVHAYFFMYFIDIEIYQCIWLGNNVDDDYVISNIIITYDCHRIIIIITNIILTSSFIFQICAHFFSYFFIVNNQFSSLLWCFSNLFEPIIMKMEKFHLFHDDTVLEWMIIIITSSWCSKVHKLVEKKAYSFSTKKKVLLTPQF